MSSDIRTYVVVDFELAGENSDFTGSRYTLTNRLEDTLVVRSIREPQVREFIFQSILTSPEYTQLDWHERRDFANMELHNETIRILTQYDSVDQSDMQGANNQGSTSHIDQAQNEQHGSGMSQNPVSGPMTNALAGTENQFTQQHIENNAIAASLSENGTVGNGQMMVGAVPVDAQQETTQQGTHGNYTSATFSAIGNVHDGQMMVGAVPANTQPETVQQEHHGYYSTLVDDAGNVDDSQMLDFSVATGAQIETTQPQFASHLYTSQIPTLGNVDDDQTMIDAVPFNDQQETVQHETQQSATSATLSIDNNATLAMPSTLGVPGSGIAQQVIGNNATPSVPSAPGHPGNGNGHMAAVHIVDPASVEANLNSHNSNSHNSNSQNPNTINTNNADPNDGTFVAGAQTRLSEGEWAFLMNVVCGDFLADVDRCGPSGKNHRSKMDLMRSALRDPRVVNSATNYNISVRQFDGQLYERKLVGWKPDVIEHTREAFRTGNFAKPEDRKNRRRKRGPKRVLPSDRPRPEGNGGAPPPPPPPPAATAV